MSTNLSLRTSHLRHVKLSTSNKKAICTGCSRYTLTWAPCLHQQASSVRWCQPPPPNHNNSLTWRLSRLGCRRRRRRLTACPCSSCRSSRPCRWRRGISACPETLSPHPSLGRSPRACCFARHLLKHIAIGARTAGKPANATERQWWVVSALVGARERSPPERSCAGASH